MRGKLPFRLDPSRASRRHIGLTAHMAANPVITRRPAMNENHSENSARPCSHFRRESDFRLRNGVKPWSTPNSLLSCV